jgi:membrane-associated protein
MDLIHHLLTEISALLHDLPGHLALWVASMGPWVYVLVFAIIFCETGLVVTPFLPGDSLLFALGALTAVSGAASEAGGIAPEKALDFGLLAVLLILGAISGDLLNYSIGRWVGMRLFTNPNSKILNPAHVERTQEFYAKHGGKTVVIARFLPIVRTYAPFVAGLGRMRFAYFATFSVSGGALWILSFLTAGHLFGNQPQIKANFHYLILALLLIPLLPAVFEFVRLKRAGKTNR